MFIMSANHGLKNTPNISMIFARHHNNINARPSCVDTDNSSDQNQSDTIHVLEAPAPMSVEQYIAQVRRMLNDPKACPFILAEKLDRLNRMIQKGELREDQILFAQDTAERIVSKFESLGLKTSDILVALDEGFIGLEELLRRRGLKPRPSMPEPAPAMAA